MHVSEALVAAHHCTQQVSILYFVLLCLCFVFIVPLGETNGECANARFGGARDGTQLHTAG
jgi:hypothetical protein